MNNELFFDTEDNSTPCTVKSLNQIFDMEPKSSTEDESLHYAAVVKTDATQQTKVERPVPPKRSWSTRLAKIVVAFKNGESVGRVGVAILRNVEFVYRIIVYKTKTNLLATLTIEDSDEVQLRRQNSYWQFYDDIGAYWSLLFERAADEADFINKLKDSGIGLQLDIDNCAGSDGPFDEELQKQTKTDEKIDSLEKSDKDSCTDYLAEEQKKTKSTSLEPGVDPVSDRNKILVRLSKMGGQPLLPTLTDTFKNDDSNEHNNDTIDHCTSVTIIGKATYPANSSEVHTQYVSQSSALTTASSSAVFKPVEAQVVQMMLVENRTQNAELRINMDKLESKIEKVIDKIDMLQVSGEQDEELLKLEEKILALKKENRRLKREYKNGNSKMDLSYDNIFNIYGTELTNLGIKTRSDSICDMDGIVGELIDKVSNLQTQLTEKETQTKNLTVALRDQKERNQNDKQELAKFAEELELAQHKIEQLQNSLDKKKEVEKDLKARVSELKSKHATQLSNMKIEMTTTLKEIMNTLYHNLAQNIVAMDKLLPDRVLSMIGRTIRQDTLTAVARIEK